MAKSEKFFSASDQVNDCVSQSFASKKIFSDFALYNSQADIRNPLRYLLITECCFAAYQEWLAPLLIQASPLLIALRN